MMIERKSTEKIFVAAFLMSAALWLRLTSIGIDGFDIDEIFGASYVNLNLFEIIIAVLRFDIHPPLYYLQLKLWSIVSQSDAWLLANSATWGGITVAVATYGTSRIVGYKKSLLTMTLLTVLGSEIYYASELRMYAMISCLTVISWVLSRSFTEKTTKKSSLLLLTALLILSGTHSAAFIPISAILFYTFVELFFSHGITGSAKKLTPIVFFIGIGLTPCLLNASLRSVSHTGTPSFESLIMMLSGWVLGYGDLPICNEIRFFITLSIISIIIIGIWFGDRTIRLLLISFVIWPLFMMGVVSLFIRPIWIPRSAAFCAPFFAISTTLLLCNTIFSADDRMSLKKIITPFLFFIVILAACMVNWKQSQIPRKMQYREAATFLRENNQLKAPIYIPANAAFWAMARYLDKPNWGSLLAVQDPNRIDKSETWQRVYEKIGPVWLSRLGLIPSTRELPTDIGPLWIGLSALPKEVVDQGFWMVGDNNLDDPNNQCDSDQVWRFKGVTVRRCQFSE